MSPHASGRTRAATGSREAARAHRRARGEPEPTEDPDDERREDQGADEPRLDEERNVERVGPEVRPAGDELVVHGEVVQAQPEQRVRGEHVGDEVVDDEMRRCPARHRCRRASAGRSRRSPRVGRRTRGRGARPRRGGRESAPRGACAGTARRARASRTARPSKPLRDSVASSTRRRKPSSTASGQRSRCPRSSRR